MLLSSKKGNSKLSLGFTLVELMVVIAIITAISSVVLVSLNAARAKSANTTIKANLNSLRAQALVFYDTPNPNYPGYIFNYSPGGSYNGGCNKLGSVLNDQKFSEMIQANNRISPSSSYCEVRFNSWFAITQLVTAENGITWWCVDETGASRGMTNVQYSQLVSFNTPPDTCP